MAFTGWPRAALDVLIRLEGDPPLSLREEVRADRERLVRVPMMALLQDLAERDPTYSDYAVWHYRSMVRPWQQQSAMIRIDRNIEIGLGFDLDGLQIQGAWWYGGPDQRERYRAAVAGRAGARLQRVVDDLRSRSYAIQGDVMARVPRGYPADHRRAELLRHRSLLAIRHFDIDDRLFDRSALDLVQTTATELRPLLEWLIDHVTTDPGSWSDPS